MATASLELGIDIGDVDLVCQLGSPRSIASFLQRVGRSGHAVGGTPKGRLFPLSRDDLVECAALLDSVRRGELDRLTIPHQPLDVLAQQIVAEVAAQDWPRGRRCTTGCAARGRIATLARDDFAAVVRMLAEGFATSRGRRGALIHHDAINHMLRGRRGARLTALTSGGTIPDNADYQVLLEPENQTIGTRQRGFRRREPGRRHLPARQQRAIASCASSAAWCGWRMRTASRRRSRSGSARRPAAAMNCPHPCRACAAISRRGCGAMRPVAAHGAG